MTWLAQAGPLIQAAARTQSETADPLAAASLLRRQHPELTPEQASLVLEQAALRARARDRHGRPDADDLLLTRDGLEQGTRADVAARRAHLIRAGGADRVLDLTAGLGFDARAFAQAGLSVTAVERDPGTAELLSWNLRHWSRAEVVVADARSEAIGALMLGLAPTDVVFADPARRDPAGPRNLSTGRARPERDPQRWSPPLSFLLSLAHPRVVVKAAPAFEPPEGWRAEWVSHERTLLECTAWSWPAFPAARRAVIMGEPPTVIESPTVTETPGEHARAGDLGPLLLEPDPALVRAGLPSCPGLTRLDDASTWLTGDIDLEAAGLGPALRAFRIVEVLDGSAAQQRRRLAALGITRLTVKSRDTAVDPREHLARLGVREGGPHVLVLTRHAGRMLSVLTTPGP